MPLRDAIDAAAGLEIGGVAFDAVGELAPDQLSQTGRRHLKRLLETRRLSVIGVGVGAGRGFDVEDRLEARIAKTTSTLALAYDMGASFAFHHLGAIPAEADEPRKTYFFEAISRIVSHANRVGAAFAAHLAFDPPAVFAKLLQRFDNPGLQALYDPVNALVRGVNPYDGVEPLAGRIAGVFCKDVLRTGASVSGFVETVPGKGEIDWPRLLGALEQASFAGSFVVAREAGNSRTADLRDGVNHLAGAAYG